MSWEVHPEEQQAQEKERRAPVEEGNDITWLFDATTMLRENI